MARKMTPMFEDFLPSSAPKKAPAKKPTLREEIAATQKRIESGIAAIEAAQEAATPAAARQETEPFREDLAAARTDLTQARKDLSAARAGRITTATGSVTAGDTKGAGGGFDMNAYLAQQAANDRIAREEAARQAAEDKRRAGQSAYNLLLEQFNQFGMGALVQPLQDLIVQGLSAAEMTLRLRETDAYKKRFAANQQRINRGLRALSEAEYIGLEDQYQNVMRNYGLPASYYTRGEMGRQEGFERFISGDVSAAELEDRIQTAQSRVINAAPEVARSLRAFYPDITNGDILAYALDPEKALTDIRRKVTAAEIGAGAAMAGLGTTAARAEELGRYGVTGEAARQGFRTVADIAPRGSQLAEIYKQTPYTQATAEQEVFGLGGAAEAGRQRRKLTELEQAAFSGQTGMAGGALARDRAGAF